jgi:hypothetical protein
MKSIRLKALAVAALGGMLVLAPMTRAEKDAMGFVRVYPEDVQWKEMPGYDGVKVAVIEGNPKETGI